MIVSFLWQPAFANVYDACPAEITALHSTGMKNDH